MISRGEPVRATGEIYLWPPRCGHWSSERVHTQGCVRAGNGGSYMVRGRGRVQARAHSLWICLPSSGKGSLYPVESRAGTKGWSWHPCGLECLRVGETTGAGRQIFHLWPPCCILEVSRHVYVLWLTESSVFHGLPYDQQRFQSWLGELSLWCCAPGLGGLLCDSDSSQDPWVHAIPPLLSPFWVQIHDHSLFCISCRTSCGPSLFPAVA